MITVRVRVRVKAKVRVRVKVRLGLGTSYILSTHLHAKVRCHQYPIFDPHLTVNPSLTLMLSFIQTTILFLTLTLTLTLPLTLTPTQTLP